MVQGSPTNLERPDISSGKGQRYLSRDQYAFSPYLSFLLQVPGFTSLHSLLYQGTKQHLGRAVPQLTIPHKEPVEEEAEHTQGCLVLFSLLTMTETLTHIPKREPACSHIHNMIHIYSIALNGLFTMHVTKIS